MAKTTKRRPKKKRSGKASSKIEIRITKLLNGSKFVLAGKEFDCLYTNEFGEKCIIEIDGDYHHRKYLHDMNLMQMANYCNDRAKNKLMEHTQFKFYRIHTSKLRFKRKITKKWLEESQYYTPLVMDPHERLFNVKAIKPLYKSPAKAVESVSKFLALCIPNYNKALFERKFKHILTNKIYMVLTYNSVIDFNC